MARCTTLRRLDLAHNGFSDAGACALAAGLAAGSPTLRVLLLGFNSIGAVGAVALAAVLPSCASLEHLDLCCNVLGSAGTSALAAAIALPSASVLRLNLACNNCCEADGERGGVRALCRALERNRTLLMLNLRGNGLRTISAGDVAEAMLENSTLVQLDIGYVMCV